MWPCCGAPDSARSPAMKPCPDPNHHGTGGGSLGGRATSSAGQCRLRGRSTSSGEDQINFTIPNIPGCYVPVFVKIGNIVSNTVSMAIMPSGGMCSDPLSYQNLSAAYVQANGLKQGSVTLSRTSAAILGFNSTTDTASGSFDSYSWAQLAMSRGLLGSRSTAPAPSLPSRATRLSPPTRSPQRTWMRAL